MVGDNDPLEGPKVPADHTPSNQRNIKTTPRSQRTPLRSYFQPTKAKSRKPNNNLPTPTLNGLRRSKIDGANLLPPGTRKSKKTKNTNTVRIIKAVSIPRVHKRRPEGEFWHLQLPIKGIPGGGGRGGREIRKKETR